MGMSTVPTESSLQCDFHAQSDRLPLAPRRRGMHCLKWERGASCSYHEDAYATALAVVETAADASGARRDVTPGRGWRERRSGRGRDNIREGSEKGIRMWKSVG